MQGILQIEKVFGYFLTETLSTCQTNSLSFKNKKPIEVVNEIFDAWP